MRKETYKFRFLVFIFILIASNLESADLKMGVSANYILTNYNSINIPGIPCGCEPITGGTGSGYSASFVLELNKNTFFVDSWVLRAGMQSNPLSVSNYENNIVKSGDYVSDLRIKNVLEITNKSVFIDFMYKLSLFETGFHLSLGPGFSYIFQSNTLKGLTLGDNQCFYSEDGTEQKSIDAYNDAIPGLTKLRINLKCGLQYDLYIGDFCTSIGAFYNYPLNNLNTYGWKANYFQLGFDFLFVL